MPIRDRRVLYVRSKGKNTFYTPGGKREEGESDTQALIREIKEELNVDLIPETINYMCTFTDQAHGKPEGVLVEIKCYEGRSVGEPVPSSEIEELAWFNSDDLDRTTSTGKLILLWLKERDLID